MSQPACCIIYLTLNYHFGLRSPKPLPYNKSRVKKRQKPAGTQEEEEEEEEKEEIYWHAKHHWAGKTPPPFQVAAALRHLETVVHLDFLGLESFS